MCKIKIQNSILREILMLILGKEVIKMKKLIMVVMAIAMVAAFMPIADASETAQLGLTVTFKANEPLKISTYPEGPFKVEEGKYLYFRVEARDADASMISLSCEGLPEGAAFVPDQTFLPATTYIAGTFTWTPKMGQSHELPYKILFTAKSELKNGDGTAKAEDVQLVVEITVIRVEPVISIELYPNSWNLDGVKLGELRTNYGYWNRPMHYISNTGNVPVLVEIGYGPQIDRDIAGIVHPGLIQGLDTFTTAVGAEASGAGKGVIIPPNGRVKAANVAANSSEGLILTYGAPTKLSDNINSMSAVYELRATAAIKPEVDPIVTQ